LREKSSDFFLGSLLIGIGAFLLLTSLGLGDLLRFLGRNWPLLLIAFGVYLLLVGRRETPASRQERHPAAAFNPTVQNNVFLGDIDLNFERSLPVSGSYRVTMGSIRVDADRLNLAAAEHSIHLNVSVGDIRIRTLRELPLRVQAHVALGDIKVYGHKEGGFNRETVYESSSFAGASQRVTLICSTIVGNIKIL
jgi:predicted membrane protein